MLAIRIPFLQWRIFCHYRYLSPLLYAAFDDSHSRQQCTDLEAVNNPDKCFATGKHTHRRDVCVLCLHLYNEWFSAYIIIYSAMQCIRSCAKTHAHSRMPDLCISHTPVSFLSTRNDGLQHASKSGSHCDEDCSIAKHQTLLTEEYFGIISKFRHAIAAWTRLTLEHKLIHALKNG